MTLRCRQNVAQPQPTLHKITHVEKPPPRITVVKRQVKSLISIKARAIYPNFQFSIFHGLEL